MPCREISAKMRLRYAAATLLMRAPLMPLHIAVTLLPCRQRVDYDDSAFSLLCIGCTYLLRLRCVDLTRAPLIFAVC